MKYKIEDRMLTNLKIVKKKKKNSRLKKVSKDIKCLPRSAEESDFLISAKTFSALAAAEWKAVLALETKETSISCAGDDVG